jgi:hypothetical protein
MLNYGLYIWVWVEQPIQKPSRVMNRHSTSNFCWTTGPNDLSLELNCQTLSDSVRPSVAHILGSGFIFIFQSRWRGHPLKCETRMSILETCGLRAPNVQCSSQRHKHVDNLAKKLNARGQVWCCPALPKRNVAKLLDLEVLWLRSSSGRTEICFAFRTTLLAKLPCCGTIFGMTIYQKNSCGRF